MTQAATSSVKTTCPYCGVGCGIVVNRQWSDEGWKAIEVVGDTSHPANLGRLCSKGSKLLQTANKGIYDQVRATQPMSRQSRNQPLTESDWDEALGLAAKQFADIIGEHGPNSVAFYISGQLLTEDYYAFNKLAKALIGTNNIDTNSRLCMSSAVSGYKRSLGADAPPCSYTDIEQAECIFIAGSNMAFAHPVAFRRLEAARKANPKQKLIVVDPRQTDTTEAADLHLAILPGTDVMLFNGMLHLMLQNGCLNGPYIEQYTEGFEALAAKMAEFTPQLVSSVCGIKTTDLLQATEWFAQSESTLSLYCQGLNQASTGTDKNTSLINLHLATGQIGKPGAGPFSLTGQPNAMGGREVGGLATLLPAHRELSNPQHVAEMADYWGVKQISNQPGASATELFAKLLSGEIKAVYIACTNPAHSLPNSNLVKQALQAAKLVVVQDAYLSTATVAYADVLLPATTWGEKEGTVTNSERCISRVRQALPAPGEARADWLIATQFGRILANELSERGIANPCLKGEAASLLPWASVEEIFNEHRATTAGRDLDITGLSYTVLENQGPQQWPFVQGTTQGTTRLYADGVFPTASGKARFVVADYVPVAEDADQRYPWRLNTGRLRDQWHGGSRTGSLPELFSHESMPTVSLCSNDMRRLQVSEGDWLRVSSRRGKLILPVKQDDGLAMGSAYVPMHWGPEYVACKGQAGGVNVLTTEVVDPYSLQPELKHAAVQLTPVKTPWQVTVFTESEAYLNIWQQARALYSEFDAAICVPIGRGRPGVMLKAVCTDAPEQALLTRLAKLFGLTGHQVMKYQDPAGKEARLLAVKPESIAGKRKARLTAVLVAGRSDPSTWLKAFWEQDVDIMPYRAQLLSPSSQAPVQGFAPVKTICNCVGVSETSIQQYVAEAAVQLTQSGETAEAMSVALLNQLQCTLKCGTECGSCVPELKRLVNVGITQVKAPINAV